MEEKKLGLLDALFALARHKKFIILTTFIISCGMVAYVLLCDQYWTSSVSFQAIDSDSGISADLGSVSSLLSSVGGGMLGGYSSNVQEMAAVLSSRTFTDDVIHKFKLIEYFEIDEPDTLKAMDLARKALHEHFMGLDSNLDTGVVAVSIRSKNKYLSAEIANYYAQLMDNYNKAIRLNKGRDNRIFLEKRLAEVRARTDSLEQKINAFQKANGAIDLENQTKSIITSYADLIAAKTSAEVELSSSRLYSSPNSAVNQALTDKISSLSGKIKQMETGKMGGSYMLAISSLPDLAREYANLLTDLEIQKQIYTYLMPQYESSKLQELQDMPTIQLIDTAVPAGIRAYPRRALMCVAAFLAGLILSSLYVLIRVHLAKTGLDKMLIEVVRAFTHKYE